MKNIEKNVEYLILEEFKAGKNISQIANTFKCGRPKVRDIIKHGKWYFDLVSKKLIFTKQKISLVEQLFHFLYDKLDSEGKNFKVNKTLSKKKNNQRVASWLVIFLEKEEEKEKLIARCNKWFKKEKKLVGFDYVNNQILSEILEVWNEFVENEEELFEKSYYFDNETGYPKGFKLFYCDLYLKPYMLEKSLDCIKKYIGFNGSDMEYTKMIREELNNQSILETQRKISSVTKSTDILAIDYLTNQVTNLKPDEIEEKAKYLKKYSQNFSTAKFFHRYKIRIGIELGKWGKKMLEKGYSIDDIYSRLERRCNFYFENKNGTIDLPILKDDVPRIVYICLEAYKNNAINEEMKKKVEETFL